MNTLSVNYEKITIIVVEDGELEGMTLVVDRESGETVGLSSRSSRNEAKRRSMPSLKDYSALKEIDFHNYRYMRTVADSIGDLRCLQRLILSRCDLLQKLPPSIGKLDQLIEVS